MRQQSIHSTESAEHSQRLTIDAGRKWCYKAIETGFQEADPTLVEALPSMGKSSGVIRWAADSLESLTVLTARHDLYDQYREWCDDEGLTYRILPSFHHDCDTANGGCQSSLQEETRKAYSLGLSGHEIHSQAQKLFGEKLPCQREGDCPYLAARDFDPATYDVLIGHYKHAHVPKWIDGRYVVFDEFPEDDYIEEFDANTVNRAVSEYLERHDGLPFGYIDELKEGRRNPERRQQGEEWFAENEPDLERDVSGVLEDRAHSANAQSPILTYAILVSERLDNKWEYAELPGEKIAVKNPNDGTLSLLNPPAVEGAESVLALDGTPTVEKWRLILGDDLQHQTVLSCEEREEYLKEVLGLRIIQISDDAQHYSGRKSPSITPEKDIAILREVKKRERQKLTLITSLSAKNKYESDELDELLVEQAHYGDLKGMNDFASSRLGAVFGSPHYGDEYLQKWAALAGQSIERREGTKGMVLDYGEFGNQLLYGMREKEVLQAAMRFGRDGNEATVYVNTGAIPTWAVAEKEIADVHRWDGKKKGMNSVIEQIQTHGDGPNYEWTAPEIIDEVDISDTMVRNHLNHLEKYGYLECDRSGRTHTWRNIKIEEAQEYGHVQFTAQN